MNKRRITFFLILSCLPLAGILLNSLYLQSAIAEAYNGYPDPFLQLLIDTLYPRFEIEKSRFNLVFFLTKADQVVYRYSFVHYTILVLFFLSKQKDSFSIRMNRVFHSETSSNSIHILRCIFFSYSIYLSLELCHDLIVLQPMAIFYKPIIWLRIIPIPFPQPFTIYVLAGCWVLLQVLILLNFRIVLLAFLNLFFFLLVQCWIFGFEKLDHGYVTFTYVLIVLPFLFLEQKKSESSIFHSWALGLIRISIAMVYLLSGLEKLFISKLSWLNPQNLKGYLSLHETDLSKIIIQYDALCILISALTLAFQLSFILILFMPKQKWIWLCSGILFHTATLLVMNIGHPLNPWIIVYIFFIDWDKLYSFLSERLKNFTLSSNS